MNTYTITFELSAEICIMQSNLMYALSDKVEQYKKNAGIED